MKIRSGLVHRRSTSMARLDSLLEIMGPAWVAALGSDMTLTALRFLARYGHPVKVKRLGQTRLTEFLQRSSRRAWGTERAAEIITAAETTLRLWGEDGMDFDELAADIAAEARLALTCSEHHNSAICTIAEVLLTRIAACLRNNTHYELRDIDGTPITENQGRAIAAAQYTIPPETRTSRRRVTSTRRPRRYERAKTGVANRSEAPPVPQPA